MLMLPIYSGKGPKQKMKNSYRPSREQAVRPDAETQRHIDKGIMFGRAVASGIITQGGQGDSLTSNANRTINFRSIPQIDRSQLQHQK